MRYTYNAPLNQAGKWQVKKTTLGYVKEKPTELFGDVRAKSRKQSKDYLDFKQGSLRIEPPLKKVGLFTRVVGYLPCQDETGQSGYLRILKPASLRISLVIILIIGILGTAFGYWYTSTKKEIAAKQEQKLLTYNAPQDLKNDDPTQIAVPAYNNFYVDAKTQEFQSPLINVAGNQCLMKYSIINKNTGETIFSTDKLLKPGKAFYNFKPNKALLVGTYDVYIKIESYSLKNSKKQLTSSTIESQVIVQ